MGTPNAPPRSGVRFELERSPSGPPWIYEGHVATPGVRLPLRAVVGDDGEVSVDLEAGGPPAQPREDLEEAARLLVRTAVRRSREDDPAAPPPRRITRWRGPR